MKKSKLFKLVKESLKEVLKEQQTVPDTRKTDRKKNKEKAEIANIPITTTLRKNILGTKKGAEAITNWLNGLNPKGGKLSPSNTSEILQAWDDIKKQDDGVNDGGAYTGVNPIGITTINGSNGCTNSTITDGWVNCTNSSGNQDAIFLDGNEIISDDIYPCAPAGTANTLANFLSWLGGSYFAGIISSWSSISPGTNIDGVSDTCPACIKDNVDQATTNSTLLPTPIDGNNIGFIIAGGNASVLLDDKSCEFGNFCTRQHMDNDWCRPVANGGYGDICTGQQAKLSVFAAIGVDNDTCTWDGCIDVPIDNSYVCSLFAGALCGNVSGPLGEEQPPGTFNNVGCTAFPGCTNSNFIATSGGNYDNTKNVDDGTCTLNGYCDDNTAPNYVCNLNGGLFCDASNVLVTSYTDNINQSQTITWGTADNTNCGSFGCADDGSDPTYPGRPTGPDAPPANWAPSNYNSAPGVIDDGSCIYDSDLDGTWDWDEVDGCTDPTALNYDPLATELDGTCISPVLGCTDDGNLQSNLLISDWTTIANLQDWWEGSEDANPFNYSLSTSINSLNQQVPNPTTYPNVISPDYDSTANIDDGSCTYPQGCTQLGYSNYDSNAIIDDGTCALGSCMEPTAVNFNSQATTDDGSCVFEGCTSDAAALGGLFDFDGLGTQTVLNLPGSPYDGRILSPTLGDTFLLDSCEFEGCLSPTDSSGASYSNYICDIAANAGYGALCSWIGTSGTPDTTTWGPNAFLQGTAPACNIDDIPGCQDNTPGVAGTVHDNPDVNGNGSYTALNYNPDATTPFDCNYTYCGDDLAYNYAPTSWGDGSVLNNDLCEYEGCADSSYIQGSVSQEVFPGNLPAQYYYNVENDGCQINPNAPTQPNGLFLTGDLSLGNTSCCAGFGCMDDGNVTDPNFWTTNNAITNTNYATVTGLLTYPGYASPDYDSNATIDDGSCTYPSGCTNNLAPNYDSTALIDDGSCQKECMNITVEQCYPELNNGTHSIGFSCAHIGNDTPQIGDSFHGPTGVYSNHNDPQVTIEGPACINHCTGIHNIAYPPFGVPGQYDGHVVATGNNFMWQGTSQDCCDYQWSSGDSCWQPYPIGEAQNSGCPEKTAQKFGMPAVWIITEISPGGIGLVTNYAPWNCGTPPPELSADVPTSGHAVKTDKEPKKLTKLKQISEVEESKRIRKSLKDLYMSEDKKLKKIIGNIIKKGL